MVWIRYVFISRFFFCFFIRGYLCCVVFSWNIDVIVIWLFSSGDFDFYNIDFGEF